MGRTVRTGLTEKDAILADCDAARHNRRPGARAAPPALLRRGRRGAQLLARGRSAAHGRLAREPGDPAARGRARRRALRPHDPQRDADRSGAAAARGRRRALQAVEEAFANATRAGHGVLGTLRLGCTPAARHEIRPALVAALREQHPGIEVDASEATTGNLCRELLSHRLDVAVGFCTEPVPGPRAPDAAARAPVRADARLAPARGRRGASLAALRDDRFVVPARRISTPASTGVCGRCAASRLRAGVRRRQPHLGRRGVAAGRRPGHARHRAGRAAPAPHMRAALLVPEAHLPIELVWREDDDSPVLRRFLEVATPSPEPARGS